jgi:cobalt-zinc-cadmium efflux system protein
MAIFHLKENTLQENTSLQKNSLKEKPIPVHNHDNRPSPHHDHHHRHEISEKTVRYLLISFIINIMLSVVEIIGGLFAGSVSLIGDALHNTSDAFSILIAVIAFKIGRKKADKKYTYGFKRAEIIGGFVNLILLFISGLYLLAEGVERLFSPEPIEGSVIIWVSVLALIIDTATAKLSHQGSDENTNMRMVFLHNLADALGSVGVIISGLFVVWFNIFYVDGIVALLIAVYMIYQSVLSFPKTVNILMNAAPEGIDMEKVRQSLENLQGVQNIHHLHIWSVNEKDISLECHMVADNTVLIHEAAALLREKYGINHCNIQLENVQDSISCEHCSL